MTATKLPAPFTITTMYKTKHGRDGWELSPHWKPRGWYNTKKAATADAITHHTNAHEADPKILAHSVYAYLDWLLKVWPEAPSALAAKVIQDAEAKRQYESDKAAAESTAAEKRLNDAAPTMFSALEEALEALKKAYPIKSRLHSNTTVEHPTIQVVRDAIAEARNAT